ncbi:MAG: type II toxin-antitoxin system CcdA family antitoxin [Pseudomonadota bacterium]
MSINADLLRQAKALDINLSAGLEAALVDTLRQWKREQWLADNKAAMDAYNQQVEDNGVFSDGLRAF